MNIDKQMEIIHKETCRVFNVDYLSTFLKSRKRELKEARQVTMYVSMLKIKKISLAKCGAFFFKDHTTVLHSKKTVSNLMDTEWEFKNKVNEVVSYYVRAFRYEIKHEENMTQEEVLRKMKKLIYKTKDPHLTVNANKLLSLLNR